MSGLAGSSSNLTAPSKAGVASKPCNSKPPSLREAVRWIAQLGGFLGRKGDGEPGVQTLWRGMQRLHDLAEMWKRLHSSQTYG